MSKPKAITISIMEWLEMFSAEHKAVGWLENRLWKGKPVCGHCGCDNRVSRQKSKRFHYWCGHCRKQFTVRTNTIISASKIQTRKWIVAIYYVLATHKGISSLQLSKELGITQRSAWFMLQRIREACKSGPFKLSGTVEVDETYIGCKEEQARA